SCMKVKYDENDDISTLSNFMLDLDDTRRHANILLECEIDRDKLVRDQPEPGKKRKKFFENTLSSYLNTKIYAFDDYGHDAEAHGAYYLQERNQLQEKRPEELKRLLHFQVIHARRNVASSEESGRSSNPLGSISTQFLKRKNSARDKQGLTENDKDEALKKIDELLENTDTRLDGEYSEVFGKFLQNASKFLNLRELKVISNLQSQTLIENSSKIVFGVDENKLPENHNGLGYLNILYLLLTMEMVKEEFEARQATLNFLIIEEPEAHTHPQMQYVFASQVRELIDEIPRLQAVVTTHSSHIVSKSEFEDIRYLAKAANQTNVEIKNFHTELSRKFTALHGGEEGALLFKFLSQYLSIQSSELFFADKAIFIEGTTERILLPLLLSKHDSGPVGEAPLSSQNISVLEVGANAKAFAPFLEFLGIRGLVITDIDTTVKVQKDKKAIWQAAPVAKGTNTSNATLKFFFDAPEKPEDSGLPLWVKKLKLHELKILPALRNLHVAYQSEEDGYHARSFEDAFIALNLKEIAARKEKLKGLKNKHKIDAVGDIDFYKLTNDVIDKKSDFASSILFEALANGQSWHVPSYILEGLKWLHKK
ncbi:ATP-dependent nuclease, partial [Salipiger bermudensis]|uniref:ATP-dependent nuclease n=1 Tax=Salipiger bermudensis TaxID=344736 RepID=UPI001C30AE8A